MGHPSWDCSQANSLNFRVPMEPEVSELPKCLVLGRDENLHIRLIRSIPLDDMRCYKTLALIAPCLANFHEDKWELRPGRWHVHVVNNLRAGKTLFAHCQSKNDDIGNRTIAPGAEITWSFKPNFFGTTLYWCYTRTDHEHTAFDVYWEESKHNWLRYRCNYKECFWIAKDDGFYIRVIPEKRDELIHKWEPGW
ncbi:hypothetical protein DVH24_010449 [Malus domestica]|uniref:S-protein homolog n=1 Tax=Malus domestica TaxID=3750 RepID=A0A498JWH5_MALDO|nr:hypothetical protein DVH24_010449 [Malus domestica]